MTVTITWRRALVAVVTLAALGFGVVWSGILNVGASSGHAAITDWFLHWAMRNTVRTYAALTVAEPAADPSHLVAAAGHFAATCAVCHGAPGEQPSPVMQASTPPAPDLGATVPTWSNRELFWIIKHGVKFTAMPAWPALSRDDEIRRMTAFVRRLPGMTAAEYRELAYGRGAIAGGAASDVEHALADCLRCHADNGRGEDVPIIAGQKAAYLAAVLDDYAEGRRASGVMGAAAARVDAPVRRALAERFAAQPGGLVAPAFATPVDATGDVRRAADVVANGMPERDLPACASCHARGKRERYPLLAGQKGAYLAARLRLWRGDPYVVDAREDHRTMPAIARRIPADLIEPLAEYLAAQ